MDEGGGEVSISAAIEHHRELEKKTAATIGFPGMENGNGGPIVVVWSMEGTRCSRGVVVSLEHQ